jgi:hypothetical protein
VCRYQLQYRTSASGAWIDLGQPVQGTGSRMTLTDAVAPNSASRFYRIIEIP